MPKKYKFKFNYTSLEILDEQLKSLDYFEKKNKKTYEYRPFYSEEYVATIVIEKDGLLFAKHNSREWFFSNLEKMIVQNYTSLSVMNLRDNVSYAFEKLGICQNWIKFGLLTKEELADAYAVKLQVVRQTALIKALRDFEYTTKINTKLNIYLDKYPEVFL